LLAIWRQAIEVLQSLFELLLPVLRKPAELGIALQGAPLLVQGLITVLI